MKHRLFYDVFV